MLQSKLGELVKEQSKLMEEYERIKIRLVRINGDIGKELGSAVVQNNLELQSQPQPPKKRGRPAKKDQPTEVQAESTKVTEVVETTEPKSEVEPEPAPISQNDSRKDLPLPDLVESIMAEQCSHNPDITQRNPCGMRLKEIISIIHKMKNAGEYVTDLPDDKIINKVSEALDDLQKQHRVYKDRSPEDNQRLWCLNQPAAQES